MDVKVEMTRGELEDLLEKIRGGANLTERERSFLATLRKKEAGEMVQSVTILLQLTP